MLGTSQHHSHMLHSLGSPQYAREITGHYSCCRKSTSQKLLRDTVRLRTSHLVSEWRGWELEEHGSWKSTTAASPLQTALKFWCKIHTSLLCCTACFEVVQKVKKQVLTSYPCFPFTITFETTHPLCWASVACCVEALSDTVTYRLAFEWLACIAISTSVCVHQHDAIHSTFPLGSVLLAMHKIFIHQHSLQVFAK